MCPALVSALLGLEDASAIVNFLGYSSFTVRGTSEAFTFSFFFPDLDFFFFGFFSSVSTLI